MAKKTVVYRTKLSLEECREQLRTEAETSTFFPNLQLSKEFIVGMRGNRFWVKKNTKSHGYYSSDYQRRSSLFSAPVFHGRLRTDTNGVYTIIEGHFAFEFVITVMFLFLGSCLLFLLVHGKPALKPEVISGLIVIPILIMHWLAMRNNWASQPGELLNFIKKTFSAEEIG